MNFSEYARQYQNTVLVLRKPATIASMNSHIRKAEKLHGSRELSELNESWAQFYIGELHYDNMSNLAIRNYWGTVSKILSRAKKENLISAVPEPELPRGFKNKQISLTSLEMHDIIKSVEEPYSTFFYLLAETGLRISEALALKPEDIVGDQLSVKRSLFNGKEQNPKTENSIRELSISTILRERIQRRIDSRDTNNLRGYIFPFTRNGIKSSIGIKERIRGNKFHGFRRGNASMLAEIACPESVIRARLGHAGDVTSGYITVKPGIDKIWAEKLSEILSEPMKCQ